MQTKKQKRPNKTRNVKQKQIHRKAQQYKKKAKAKETNPK